MRVDPIMAALRSDHASQRQIQSGMEAIREEWLRTPDIAAIVDDIRRYAAGVTLGQLPRLAALIGSFEIAHRFATGWSDMIVDALGRHRLGLVPFQYTCSQGFSAVRILNVGGVSLSLLAYEERADIADYSSACFADRDLHEIVLAGQASGFVHRLAIFGNRPVTRQEQWGRGTRISTLGAGEARQVGSVHGRLSILQLARENPSAVPTREISLEDGRVLHVSSGDKGESQREMALAVLGAMRRLDAVPQIEQLARSGTPHLRWQALRHAIALDPQRGVALLTRIANDAGDELAGPASDLRRHLAATYPQLLQQEPEPCPA